MKTAEQIMRKKTSMRKELDKHLQKDEADALWTRATEKLTAILTQYANLPGGLRFHTESRIFPSAAVYLTAKERLGEETAYGSLPGIAFERTGTLGKGAERCDFRIRKT